MALALDRLDQRERATSSAASALEIFEEIEDPNPDMVREQLAEWRGEA